MASVEVSARGYEQVTGAHAKLNKEAEKTPNTFKLTEREARNLGRVQQRVLRDVETAQEKYNRKLKEAQQALAGHAREEELLGRARKKLHAEYQRDLQKDQVELKNLGPPLKDVDEASNQAFAKGRVGLYGAAIAAATAGATKLHGVLRSIREEAEQFADQQLETATVAGKLVQLAGDDPMKRDALSAASDKIFAEGFVRSRNDAINLAYELDSAGRLGDREFFSRLSTIDDAAGLAKSTGLISSGFSGGDDVGSSAEIISKAIAGALPATGVSSANIAEGVAIASASAKAFDLSDEELFAAISRVAQVTGSGSQAGTRINQLLSSLTRQGFADRLRGQGVFSVLDAVGAEATTSEELVKLLGSDEAVKAFDVLKDQGALRARLGEIQSAQTNLLAERTIDNALGIPLVRAAVTRRRGEAADILSRDETSTATNLSIGRERSAEAARRDAGTSEVVNRFEKSVDRFSRTLFGPDDVSHSLGAQQAREFFESRGESTAGRSDLEVLADLVDLQKQQLAEARKQTQKLDRIKTPPFTIPVK